MLQTHGERIAVPKLSQTAACNGVYYCVFTYNMITVYYRVYVGSIYLS